MQPAAAPETPIPPKKRFENFRNLWASTGTRMSCAGPFIKKHKRWFTFVGAFIVFATFVAKEVVRDDLKDVVSGFENAQTTFALRDQNMGMTTTMTEIRTRVVALSDKSLPKMPGGVWRVSQAYAVVEETRETVELLRQSLVTITALAQKLPKDEKREAELVECTKLVAQTRDDYGKALDVLKDVLTRAQASKRDLTKEDEQRMVSAETAYIEVQRQAALRIAAFESGVLSEAPKYREEQEYRYAWWNKASYWLYSLGWGLGLIGKIYGVEGGAEA
jgi:hypothetical protein